MNGRLQWRVRGQGGRGFTLIELLVVLALMALVAALVPTAGVKLKAAMDFREAVQNSYRMFSQARSLAVRNAESVFVEVDLERRRIGIEGHGEPVGIPGNLQLEVVVAGEISENGIGRFRFYPDGSATGGELALYRPGGRGATVHVNWLTGRARVIGVGSVE